MPIHYSTSSHIDMNVSSRSKGENIRVHFKNTRETAMAIKGMDIKRAEQYLNNVLAKKEAIPFRRFTGCIGRKAQSKNVPGAPTTQVRWPKKSVEHVLSLLLAAKANGTNKGLKTETMFVSHIAVQQAPYQRRRTYRAHGRINPYMCSPSHIQIVLSEKAVPVPKPANKKAANKKTTTAVAPTPLDAKD